MSDEEKEKILEILLAEDKQLKVDVIQLVEKNNIKDEDKDKAYKMLKERLQDKRKRFLCIR